MDRLVKEVVSDTPTLGRVLAVSHACVRRINRAIYSQMASIGWDVKIVAPKEVLVGGKMVQCEPWVEGDPPMELLELVGSNPRTYYFEGIAEEIESFKPSVVFLESDPISRLAIQIGSLTGTQGFKLACLSCENLPFDPLSVFKRMGWRGVPASFAKCLMNYRAKSLVDHVFAINDDGKKIFNELGFSSVSKIPLGFDAKYFHVSSTARTEIRSALGLNERTFAYFGRLVPEKGIHHLIEALGQIRDIPWQLILDQFEARGDEYLQRLDSLIDQYELRPRIRFVESAHGEIARYMNAADIVVLPSVSTPKWKEQYGRVAPEAMACGKVVVAFRSGALPELIGDAGILVDEGDVVQLTNTLRNLADPAYGLSVLETKAAKKAIDDLSIASQADQMSRTFLDLLGSTSR